MNKPRLKEEYNTKIKNSLQKKLNLSNVNQVPTLEKIVISMGVGEAARDSKVLKDAAEEVALITGQKPKYDRAKHSIANFKLREGVNIGVHSTVRNDRMWELFDRILSLALPRIRDFRGLSDKQFDGHGNYTFGLTEQSVFYEINPNKITKTRGMNVTIVTTADSDEYGKALLDEYGFPFKKIEENS